MFEKTSNSGNVKVVKLSRAYLYVFNQGHNRMGAHSGVNCISSPL